MIRHDAIDLMPRLAPGVEICSCEEALALRAKFAELQGAACSLDDDYRAFCPQCGVGVGFDGDGCCTSCGATVCSVSELVRHLAAVALRVERVPLMLAEEAAG